MSVLLPSLVDVPQITVPNELGFKILVRNGVNESRSEPIQLSGVEFVVRIQRHSKQWPTKFFASLIVRSVVPGARMVVQTTMEVGPKVEGVEGMDNGQFVLGKGEASSQQFVLGGTLNVNEEIGIRLFFEVQTYQTKLDFIVHVRVTIVVKAITSSDLEDGNVVVAVQNREFHVSPQYLAMWSRYFEAYFKADMKEKKEGRYPITYHTIENFTLQDDDILAEDFEELLLVIHPSSKPISRHNFATLLKLANRFEMPELFRRIESYLIDFKSNELSKAKVFRLATNEYQLKLVQSVLIHRWGDSTLLEKELIKTDEYHKLSTATKTFVNDRFVHAYIAKGQSKPRERAYDGYLDDDRYDPRDFDDFQSSDSP